MSKSYALLLLYRLRYRECANPTDPANAVEEPPRKKLPPNDGDMLQFLKQHKLDAETFLPHLHALGAVRGCPSLRQAYAR
jgi:hypothetical protein